MLLQPSLLASIEESMATARTLKVMADSFATTASSGLDQLLAATLPAPSPIDPEIVEDREDRGQARS